MQQMLKTVLSLLIQIYFKLDYHKHNRPVSLQIQNVLCNTNNMN